MNRSLWERSALARWRVDAYSLLARLFDREADAELWGILANADLDSAAEALAGFEPMARYVTHPPADPLADLAIDYAATFLGIGPALEGAFPYESVYTSEDGLLMQEARDSVIEFMRAEGLAPIAAEQYREDHAATEFSVLAQLAARSLEYLDEGALDRALDVERKAVAFLERHALRWIPRWCDDVQRLARTDFYRGAARVAQETLALDAALGSAEESASLLC